MAVNPVLRQPLGAIDNPNGTVTPPIQGQPLGAVDEPNGAGVVATTPATTTATAPTTTTPPDNNITIRAGDTLWARVKEQLGADANDRDIFNATEKILKANDLTWDTAKTLSIGDSVDMSVLKEGEERAAADTTTEEPAAEAPGEDADIVSISSSKDTIWAHVKEKLGPDANNAEINAATQQVLDANDLTWESAKNLRLGDTFSLAVLNAENEGEGETVTEPTPAETEQPLGAIDEPNGVAVEAPTGNGLPLGTLEAQSGQGGTNAEQPHPFAGAFTGSPNLDTLLGSVFGSLDPSALRFLPFGAI